MWFNAQNIKSVIGISLVFVMSNFSVYLAEVDIIERVIHKDNLVEDFVNLIIQGSAEEEEGNFSDSIEVDLFLSSLTNSQCLNSFLIVNRTDYSPFIFFKSSPLGIETPPPEV